MTEKRCQLRQHLIARNVKTTEQVPYEHGDILLRNKVYSYCSLDLLLESDHQKQYLVWLPSGTLVL